MRHRIVLAALVIGWVFGTTAVLAQEDVDRIPGCKYCGMDRKNFGHSRMLLTYDDGSEFGACSLHCVAVDLALNIDKSPKTIQVGDFGTRALVDAEKAFWVLGGAKPGVMTRRAKWAFEKKADAEAFIQANGGSLVDFETAIKAAYEDMYSDTQLIRERRKAKRMKQGS
jgi:nitrous oxide reductase accessory protein NosL